MTYPATWPRFLILGLLAGGFSACSDDPPPAKPPAKAAVGEACEVTKDCEETLICRSKICATRPMTGDMDMSVSRDAAMTDMEVKVDMTPPIADEEYFISYVKKDDAAGGARFPFVIDTRTGATTKVTDKPELCEQGCWITEDLSTFVYKRSGTNGRENIFTQSIGNDFKLSGAPKELLTNITDFYFRDSILTYGRGDVPTKEIFYLPATAPDSSGEVKFHEITSTSDASVWYVSPKANKTAVFFPSDTTLNVRVADSGKFLTQDDSVFVFDAKNYQNVGNFYRGPSLPTAFSPDGRYMATAMSAPNHYDLCQQGAGKCDVSKGQKCGLGHSKVGGIAACTVQEITVHLFDLQNLQELPNGANPGKRCARDTDCSSAHECYIPDLKAANLSVCIPRRVVMGLPNTPKQPDAEPKSGCERLPVDGVNGVRRYTDYGRSLKFGADGALYTTATRECAGLTGEANIDVTDVLRIPVSERGAPSVITGNVKSDYSSLNCYNQETKKVEPATCPIYIEEAILSPGGNELVMRATNPQADDPDKADKLLDVWTVKRDGTKRTWLGKNSKGDEVTQVYVHKK